MDMNLLLKIVFFTVIVGFLIFVTIVLVERSKPDLVVTPGLLFLLKKNKKSDRGTKKGAISYLMWIVLLILGVAFSFIIVSVVFFGFNPIASIVQSKFLSWMPFF